MDRQRVVLKIRDVATLAAIEDLITTTTGFSIEVDENAPCDLLICEITVEGSEAQFNAIRREIAVGKARNVFLISGALDPNILIQALKIGAREFFPLPLKIEDVKNALLKVHAAAPPEGGVANAGGAPRKDGKIFYVVGSKGGVGTTTVAVNLAMVLTRSNADKMVSLMDMNLLFGDIPVFLGMDSRDTPLFNWAEIARNIARLDHSLLMSTLHKHPSGLHVLPSPTSMLETFADGPMIIAKLLKLMVTVFDYVVVDGGQDIGEMSKSVMKLADKVIVVSILNLPSLINVKRLRDAFKRLGYPPDDRVMVIANRVQKGSGNIAVDDAERTIQKKVSWSIPNDFSNTMNAINAGKALMDVAPGAEINKKFSEMAVYLTGLAPGEPKKKKGFFDSFR